MFPEELCHGLLLWSNLPGVAYGRVIEQRANGTSFLRAPRRIWECNLFLLEIIPAPYEEFLFVKLLSPEGIIFSWDFELVRHCEIVDESTTK